jgi:hypothetical protein
MPLGRNPVFKRRNLQNKVIKLEKIKEGVNHMKGLSAIDPPKLQLNIKRGHEVLPKAKLLRATRAHTPPPPSFSSRSWIDLWHPNFRTPQDLLSSSSFFSRLHPYNPMCKSSYKTIQDMRALAAQKTSLELNLDKLCPRGIG